MENIFNFTDKNKLTYGRGYVYSLQYHIVWCTKYRHKILQDGLDERCKELLLEIADERKFTINVMDVMPDYIHLLVDCSPQFFIPDMVKIMKGNIARKLFMEHPEIKSALYDGHLWSASYCAVTASEHSNELVRAYIMSQKTK